MEEIVKLTDEQLDEIWGGSKIPYIVKAGDTLGDLSVKFKCSIEEICRWNNIADPNKIWEDQLLIFKY